MLLTRAELDKTIKMLELSFDLTAKEGYADLIYSFLKNNSVEELRKAYTFFLKQKSMSKLPSVAQWLEAMGKDMRTPIDIACDKFLAKVQEYITSDFMFSEDKQEFIEGLSEVERRILTGFGGISALWQDCHREEYNRNTSVLLNQLKKEFMNSATENNIRLPENKHLALENNQKNKVQELLKDSIKKIA